MSLRDLLFEDNKKKPTKDTPAPPPQNQQPATRVAPVAATVPSFSGFAGGVSTATAPAFAPTTGADGAIYQSIADKTNFDSTQVGQILQQYLSPLANLPLDNNMKLKTAVAQASSHEGITPDKILGTFDGLKVALQNELDAFQDAAAKQVEREVTARQNRLTEIQQQVQSLQAEQQQLANDLVSAQTKVSSTTQQFQMAVNRRAAEIDQQKANYAAALR